ncbi:hypothetical protein LEP1GSC090_1983 [Leptospira borgpetersenii serovar Javanica str. MK146]|nr:hypothetical protein LEP1GSC090_1983 [Leptospira borgpetersenii serovar Javanica str. MK146]
MGLLLEQKNENFSESKHVCVMFLDICKFKRFFEKSGFLKSRR